MSGEGGISGGGSGGGGAAGGGGGSGAPMPPAQLARTPAALQSAWVRTLTVVAPTTGGEAPATSRMVMLKVDASRHAPE